MMHFIFTLRSTMLSVFALTAMTGCQNLNRSMVFSTGTTIGVELSTSPASDAPLQLVFGLKRAEILIDPVLSGEGADVVEPSSHSVIAKLAGRVDALTGNGVHGSQWFASGRAAELLAVNPMSAASLTNDPQVADAIARAAQAAYGPLPDASVESAKTQILADYLALDVEADSERVQAYEDAALAAGFEGFAAFVLGNPTAEQLSIFEQHLAR